MGSLGLGWRLRRRRRICNRGRDWAGIGPGRDWDFVTRGKQHRLVPRYTFAKPAILLCLGPPFALRQHFGAARIALQVAHDNESTRLQRARVGVSPLDQRGLDEGLKSLRALLADDLSDLLHHVGGDLSVGESARAPGPQPPPDEQGVCPTLTESSPPLLMVEHVVVVAEPTHPCSASPHFRR